MILVDSSVWIDYFRGSATPQADHLDALLASLEIVDIGGYDIALQAARNYRKLRSIGITVRKTVDTLIATRCIESRLTLLHSDRDFDPFAEHLGLRVVQPLA